MLVLQQKKIKQPDISVKKSCYINVRYTASASKWPLNFPTANKAKAEFFIL
jgi:hypothetical protein